MQTSKHTEQVCTPMQMKLNTIVDNTTIALKSQLNALFADLLVESEEYNETNKILLTLPIVKKLFSAMSYVTTPTQEDTEPVINTTPSNIEQTCTFNYDSLNHITPPKIDEDEHEESVKDEVTNEVKDDVQKDKEEQEEDVEEEQEDESEEDEQEGPNDTSVIEPVIESPSVSNEEGKENICLEIIEPDEIFEVKEETDEAQDDEEVDEEDEDEDEDEEEEQDDEEDEEDEEDEDEVEEPKTELEEQVKEQEEEKDEEEEEDESSEEELVTEESEQEAEEQDEEDEDDGEEVFEIDIFGKTYYTNNATNGDIYSVDESGDPGDEVGKFVKGIATFTKK